MNLNDLKPNAGAKRGRKRLGRGISAGQGKTCGRGVKGQSSRTGSGGNLYRQGGNLPFYRRLPFMRGEGFTPPNQVHYNEINLAQLTKLKAGTEVGPAKLHEMNLIDALTSPIVILGNGELKVALKVKAHRVTTSARAKIEAAGGSVEIIAG
jgi:large subunit ribosomal protein L15